MLPMWDPLAKENPMAQLSLHLRAGQQPSIPGQQLGILAYGPLFVFLLPFLGFGLFATGSGIQKWLQGDRDGIALLLFGVVFSSIPLGVAALARRGIKAKQEAAARSARHPDQPWLWNEEWATGRIHSSKSLGVIFSWIFALVWNAISFPLAISVVPREVMERGNHAALAALFFPAIGLVLFAGAIYATLQRRKFGDSYFEMSSLPGVLGGELVGTLHLGSAAMAVQGFETRLACIRRYVTGSGKNRSTHEDLRWEQEQSLPGSAGARGPSGCMLPIRFSIPYDCSASDPLPSDDYILWRLEMTASLPGIDLAESFEVPVFPTSESQPERTASAVVKERLGNLDRPPGPLSRGILVQPHAAGGKEIYFPAARHKGAALILTLLTGIFGCATYFLQQHGAPLLMPVVFGFFSSLMFYGVVTLWLSSTRVVAGPGGVTVRHGILGMGRTRTLAADQIAGIELKVGMQVGGRAYWDLWLRARSSAAGGARKPADLKAGAHIKDKQEADWLCAILGEAIGH